MSDVVNLLFLAISTIAFRLARLLKTTKMLGSELAFRVGNLWHISITSFNIGTPITLAALSSMPSRLSLFLCCNAQCIFMGFLFQSYNFLQESFLRSLREEFSFLSSVHSFFHRFKLFANERYTGFHLRYFFTKVALQGNEVGIHVRARRDR